MWHRLWNKSEMNQESEVDEQALKQIVPKIREEDLYFFITPLNEAFLRYEINTPLRQAHFIAQIAHESGSFRYREENLNYSAEALKRVFGKYFRDPGMAELYARSPEKIANRVYANRLGNGPEPSGDGWKFRGRGLIQLTGKSNYTAYSEDCNIDLIENPDMVSDYLCTDVAGWFWDSRNLNPLADSDDIEKITRKINGGLNGLEDRKVFLTRAKTVLGC